MWSPSNPDAEPVDAYVARKKAKGVWGKPKPVKRGGQTVYTGICPCRKCGHKGEPMIVCDPDYNDCACCAQWCS